MPRAASCRDPTAYAPDARLAQLAGRKLVRQLGADRPPTSRTAVASSRSSSWMRPTRTRACHRDHRGRDLSASSHVKREVAEVVGADMRLEAVGGRGPAAGHARRRCSPAHQRFPPNAAATDEISEVELAGTATRPKSGRPLDLLDAAGDHQRGRALGPTPQRHHRRPLALPALDDRPHQPSVRAAPANQRATSRHCPRASDNLPSALPRVCACYAGNLDVSTAAHARVEGHRAAGCGSTRPSRHRVRPSSVVTVAQARGK